MENKDKRKIIYKTAADILIIAVLAGVYAATLHIFVYKSGFAPAGVDGIAAMVQHLTGFNAGYTALILNIPLLAAAWFVLKRKFVIYTIAFVAANNLFILLFAHINLYQYNDPSGSYIMAALFNGLVRGALAGVVIWLGGSAGGTEIIAGLVQKRYEQFNFGRILFVLNCVVVLSSFFAYGQNLNSVFLAVISTFAYSRAIEMVLKGSKSALEFKILTERPDELRQAILRELRHGVTVVPVVGGYKGDEKTMLICVVNAYEVAEFKRIIKRFDKTFAYFGNVGDVIGNFRRGRNEEVR